MKYCGFFGFCSKYFLNRTIKLSTVRVEVSREYPQPAFSSFSLDKGFPLLAIKILSRVISCSVNVISPATHRALKVTKST